MGNLPIRRYYDSSAIIEFFSKKYDINPYFPKRNSFVENYICPNALEEATFTFIKKYSKNNDLNSFLIYLRKFTVLDRHFREAVTLYLDIIERNFADIPKKIDSNDVMLFSVAAVNGIDEFITFDESAKAFLDSLDFPDKPKIVLLPQLPDAPVQP